MNNRSRSCGFKEKKKIYSRLLERPQHVQDSQTLKPLAITCQPPKEFHREDPRAARHLGPSALETRSSTFLHPGTKCLWYLPVVPLRGTTPPTQFSCGHLTYNTWHRSLDMRVFQFLPSQCGVGNVGDIPNVGTGGRDVSRGDKCPPQMGRV